MNNLKKCFAFIVILFFISCADKTNENKILYVGKELVSIDLSKINSTENIVFVGSSLKRKIFELKKQNASFKFKVVNADLNYPYGNSEAENVLILNNGIHKINLRLKYNSKKMKFDILGFMTESRTN
ncbi:hypothetical protein [Flavobacterium bernardetii]|uniref:hypothetical protein n=1 Tax=Flavobacterium bernardetii TaxID=2813823 RepID=UPI00140B3114|nr:hypothetical protein [Flavobacterium bernardetii]